MVCRQTFSAGKYGHFIPRNILDAIAAILTDWAVKTTHGPKDDLGKTKIPQSSAAILL